PGISDVDVSLRVYGNTANAVELPRFGSARSPRLDEFSVLVELCHPCVAISIGHINVAGRIPCDIGWTLEDIALGPGTGKSASSALSPFSAAAFSSTAAGGNIFCFRLASQQH